MDSEYGSIVTETSKNTGALEKIACGYSKVPYDT